MKEKKDKFIYFVIIIMGITAIVAMALTLYVGKLYVKEKERVVIIENEKIIIENEAEALRERYENGQDKSSYSQDEVDELLIKKDNEARTSIKQEIIELLKASNSSLFMLRNLFQDKLVFTDDGEFFFVDVRNDIKKHSYSADNFKVSEDKQIEYYDNGNLISHKGIDVSKYQGNIDWKKVKADGVEFAIIRIGVRGYESGKIVLDDCFEKNIKGANEAGILTGVYFFTQAISEKEALEEADFILENIAEYDITCPIVFDVEKIEGSNGRMNKLTQEERTDVTIAFCERIKEAGYIPMIYGNIKCFGKLLDLSRLENYEKWFAFYDDYLYYPYEVGMWQYSETGKVNGIKGNVDVNISFHLW